jgi:hypothetical protein
MFSTGIGEIMEQSIIIPRKKSVSIYSSFWMLFSIAIFVLFLFMHYAKPVWFTSKVPLILVILSWIAIPILVYVFLYYFKNIFNNKPILIVNENGINDQSRSHSIGMIQWRDIEDIKIQPYMDKHFFIHIFLINPDDYIQKKPLFRSKKQGHVVIPSIYFKKDFQKVIDIIYYHFEKTHDMTSQWTDFMDEDNRLQS